MKIPPQHVANFLKQHKHDRSILLYGENFDQVIEIFQKLTIVFDKDDPFSTTILQFQDIISNISLLLDRINTQSFAGKTRLIHIKNSGELLPKYFQQIIDQVDCNSTYIIFTSKLALSPKSSLRQYFEKSEINVAIACYADEKRNIKKILEDYLKKHQINYDYQSLSAICNYFTQNRTGLYSELDKLLLYVDHKKCITEQDVIDCLSYQDISNDNICWALADKDIQLFIDLLEQQKDLLLTIRSLSQYLMKLHKVLSVRSDQQESAIAKLRPPIFFKNIAKFKSHLKHWKIDEIIIALSALMRAEISYKSNASCSEAKIMLKRIILLIY